MHFAEQISSKKCRIKCQNENKQGVDSLALESKKEKTPVVKECVLATAGQFSAGPAPGCYVYSY